MKIDIYTLCKNEIKLAPFFIDYWKALGDEVNVYIYDGLSNDGTRELVSRYDWIHIIDWEPDALDDKAHSELKNTCWKDSTADFVMVCDFDETIFSYSIEELRKELQYMKDNHYTILKPLSFNLISEHFPNYQENTYLHELAEYGYNDYIWEAKPILFNPKEIKEINFCYGAHTADPKGNVVWYKPDNLFLIHAKYLGVNFYKERINNRIISEWNKSTGLFGEKNFSDEKMNNQYRERFQKRFKWSDIKTNFNIYYNQR